MQTLQDLARIGAQAKIAELRREIEELEKFLGERPTVARPTERVAIRKARKPHKRSKRNVSPEMREKLAANLQKARAVLAEKKAKSGSSEKVEVAADESVRRRKKR